MYVRMYVWQTCIIYVHICTAINELLYTVHQLYHIYHVHAHLYIHMYIAYSSAVYTVWFMKEPWSGVFIWHIYARTRVAYVCGVLVWWTQPTQCYTLARSVLTWPQHCKSATWTYCAYTYIRMYICTYVCTYICRLMAQLRKTLSRQFWRSWLLEWLERSSQVKTLWLQVCVYVHTYIQNTYVFSLPLVWL